MAEFEYNLELTKTLFPEINLEYKKPLLEFADAKKIYEVFCINNDIEKEVIAFHVGFGGSSDANWNLDEYEELIHAVLIENKYQVVLTFGPDEKDLYEEMQTRFMAYNVVLYFSQESVHYFAKLISNFKLFVSTSTGTYHLASLVGTPTMTFFADSLFASSKRWKSIGEEELQSNYMIPSNKDNKEKLFKDEEIYNIEILDNKKIVEQLLPYYLDRVTWGGRSEAIEAIVKCGEVAGPYLLEVFNKDIGIAQLKEKVVKTFNNLKIATH